MSLQLLADAGQSEKVLIYTLIGGHVVTLLTLVIKALMDQANRVQDRLDAESKAKLLLAEGAAREKRIQEAIADNTAMNKEALEVSNGHNAKMASALTTVEEATRVIAASKGMDDAPKAPLEEAKGR